MTFLLPARAHGRVGSGLLGSGEALTSLQGSRIAAVAIACLDFAGCGTVTAVEDLLTVHTPKDIEVALQLSLSSSSSLSQRTRISVSPPAFVAASVARRVIPLWSRSMA